MISIGRRRMTISVLTMASLAAVGCGGSPTVPTVPTHVEVSGSVTAAADVNPDPEGRPSPLVVRIYQLRDTARFTSADFFALFDDAEATLGAELLGVDEIVLSPGDARPYRAEFDLATQYVGVVGAYRDINQATWRAVMPMSMPDASAIPLTIEAERLAVRLSSPR
jgi:type VI secretion system protein VasD